MVTRHMIRGYKDCVFYAERHENVEKIYQLALKASAEDEITKTEVYQLVGNRIVALELDSENIQDDTNDRLFV